MYDFAVMDDSTVRRERLFAYSHTLIIPEENALNLVFVGNGRFGTTQNYENAILEFLRKNLPEHFKLYACSHYTAYQRIWNEIVFDSVEKTKSRTIRKQFTLAHHEAKRIAEMKLEEMMQ